MSDMITLSLITEAVLSLSHMDVIDSWLTKGRGLAGITHERQKGCLPFVGGKRYEGSSSKRQGRG